MRWKSLSLLENTVWVNLSPIRCTSDFFGVPFSRDDHMWVFSHSRRWAPSCTYAQKQGQRVAYTPPLKIVHVIRVHELCLATSALVPSLSVCVGTHTLNGGIAEGKKVVMIGYGAMARLGCHHRAYWFLIHQVSWIDGWKQLRVPMVGLQAAQLSDVWR